MNKEAFTEPWKRQIKQTAWETRVKGVGQVLAAGDGVVTLDGVPEAFYGEVLENPSGFKGMVLNLRKGRAEAIVLKGFDRLREGMEVYTSGRVLKIPVGEKLLGRVINPLGEPLDDFGPLSPQTFYPMERQAAAIIDRQPVARPLQTGIKAVDALVPVGRGQRELIIGDRHTGKTALAVDTIINQSNLRPGEKPVFCIYAALGQKESKTAQIVAKLKETDALKHTIVVAAGASSPVSWQYLAPYAACALGEYFLDKGQDALVIYDDLTKHAWAYRELSLVLRRPPGREAYPGDIFYLHSKLLERACQHSEKLGGGSLTALPLVETQAGDVSAYIPTNIISITDGQIYLDRDLFNSGFRPAVNVGLSVSRVGGRAQLKTMKQLTDKLRLELAQYRELSSFSQFSADLDSHTRMRLERGAKMVELLKQGQYQPLRVSEQLIVFWATAGGYLDKISVNEVKDFEEELLSHFRNAQPEILAEIDEKAVLTEELTKKLEDSLELFLETRNYGHA